MSAPTSSSGFPVGADNKLVRYDKIVDYMRHIAAGSPRVHVRELGKTTQGNPFVAVEISAADTMARLDRFKQLQRKLYFQGGPPSAAERDEILASGKAVVLVTCNLHSTEIGASQMAVELVHRLATDNSPVVKKILDNVILVLVPSANPDGQIMVVDWFNKNLGTEFETSSMPYLYHPYVGHDNNRDMYMLTQKESQLTATLLWQDWFPSVWLDEHQMGNSGARIFVMPATDPINPNVHPLIYRWNGILGQAQAAALEAAGKDGIIYNSTYTNFWQGAMAWSGWWHNQVGLLTEVASVRVAAPVEQRRAVPGAPPAAEPAGPGGGRRGETSGPAAAASRHHAANRVPAPVDGRPVDAQGHRRLRVDRDDGDARGGGRPAQRAAPPDLRGEPGDGGRRREERAVGHHHPGVQPVRTARGGAPGREAADGRRRGVARRRRVRGGRQELPRGHARRADEPGVRALREGPAREADLPGGAAVALVAARAAVRRHGLVARHADGRRRGVREEAAAGRLRSSRSWRTCRRSPGR